MRKLLLFVLAATLLFSCVTPKRYAALVRERYKQPAPAANTPPTNIIITAPALTKIDTLVKTRKVAYSFVPAIIYIGWNTTIACQLDAQIPLKTFATNLRLYADSTRLAQQISGQRLELEVLSIPDQFTYIEKGGVVFFFITYGLQAITTDPTALVLKYKLYNGSTLSKEGRISVPYDAKPYVNNYQSTKKITRKFLDQYERNIRRLSKQCAVQLANELAR